MTLNTADVGLARGVNGRTFLECGCRVLPAAPVPGSWRNFILEFSLLPRETSLSLEATDKGRLRTPGV
jgi:hypothetical protein